MADRYLPEGNYLDVLNWGKTEDDLGESIKHVVFPITRYRNILNRPRLIDEDVSVATVPSGDFHFVTTAVEEVDDNTIYDYFKQIW